MDSKVSVTLTCVDCQRQFPHEPLLIAGREVFRPNRCPDCLEALTDAMADQKARERAGLAAARRKEWRQIALAPVYVDSDITNPGLDANALQAALAWRYGPRGLGIVGDARRGKTRSLHLALRRAWDEGRSCMAISDVQLAAAADRAAFGSRPEQRAARDLLDAARTVAVLLFDDLGKARTSPAGAEATYTLLEARTSHRLPILWSSQASGAWIEDKFGPDHGPAIVARLGLEFCDIIRLDP